MREFLAGEGILPEVEVLALKRMVSLPLQQILEQEHVTKTELISRMKTSRPHWTGCSISETHRPP